MNKLEKEQTLVKATHITKVTVKLLVTAKAEQIPKIWSVIGFSSISGLYKALGFAGRRLDFD